MRDTGDVGCQASGWILAGPLAILNHSSSSPMQWPKSIGTWSLIHICMHPPPSKIPSLMMMKSSSSIPFPEWLFFSMSCMMQTLHQLSKRIDAITFALLYHHDGIMRRHSLSIHHDYRLSLFLSHWDNGGGGPSHWFMEETGNVVHPSSWAWRWKVEWDGNELLDFLTHSNTHNGSRGDDAYRSNVTWFGDGGEF